MRKLAIGASFLALVVAALTLAPTARLSHAYLTDLSYSRSGHTGFTPQLPVGFVFVSTTCSDPGAALGYGTWSAIGAGRVLVGRDTGDADFDVAEETGGSKTVAATGSISGIVVDDHANHTHSAGTLSTANHSSVTTRQGTSSGTVVTSTGHSIQNNTGNENSTLTHTVSNNGTFTGTATSVVQPYLVVCFYERTE